MSIRQRNMGVNVADRENVNKQPAKVGVPKPLTRGPVLGELGNRLPIQNQSNITNKKPVTTTTSLAALKVPKPIPLKLKKEATVTVATKTTYELVQKKSQEAKQTSTLKRQESTLLKNIVRVADHKIGEQSSYSTKQLVGVIDPDANDKSDPFLVAEYVQDIFNHLRSLESKYKIRENHLLSHRTSPRMRGVLINWMVDVHINFKFLQETLHLSVAVLDRYLQLNHNIGRETLQLVGTASMIIAGKYEEMYMPEISDFEYLCDNSFSHSEILKMELEILCKLKWNLGRPLALHFLRRYNKIARVTQEHHDLAKYFLEICLLEYELCHINPSIQAAAACCLSASILNESEPAKVWNKSLAYYSTYKYCDIKPVIINLAHFVGTMETCKFQAVRKKYAASELGKISHHSKLQGPQMKRLLQEAQILRKKS